MVGVAKFVRMMSLKKGFVETWFNRYIKVIINYN